MNTMRGALALPLLLLLLFTATDECQAGACFTDKTSSINITLTGGTSTGLATFDFNADGLLDLQISYDSEATIFFEGLDPVDGFPQWSDETADIYPQSSAPDEGALRPIPVDYDNDGDIDLYVFSDDDGGNLLYRNNGNGTFTEVVSTVGIRGSSIYDGWIAAWGDYDADGWVDLVIDGGGRQLLRNNGATGTIDFTVTSGVLPTLSYMQLPGDFVWVDVDHDGDLDLFELLADTTGSGRSDPHAEQWWQFAHLHPGHGDQVARSAHSLRPLGGRGPDHR